MLSPVGGPPGVFVHVSWERPRFGPKSLSVQWSGRVTEGGRGECGCWDGGSGRRERPWEYAMRNEGDCREGEKGRKFNSRRQCTHNTYSSTP